MTKTPEKSTYIAKADGWIGGKRVKAGDTVSLTAAAARYEPVQAADAKKTPRPSRAARNEPIETPPPAKPEGAGA